MLPHRKPLQLPVVYRGMWCFFYTIWPGALISTDVLPLLTLEYGSTATTYVISTYTPCLPVSLVCHILFSGEEYSKYFSQFTELQIIRILKCIYLTYIIAKDFNSWIVVDLENICTPSNFAHFFHLEKAKWRKAFLPISQYLVVKKMNRLLNFKM